MSGPRLLGSILVSMFMLALTGGPDDPLTRFQLFCAIVFGALHYGVLTIINRTYR